MKYFVLGGAHERDAAALRKYAEENTDLMFWDFPNRFKNRRINTLCNFFSGIIFRHIPIVRGMLKFIYRIPDIDSDEVIFVYFMPFCQLLPEIGYYDLLKKKYPRSMHVTYLTDVKRTEQYDLDFIKSVMDLVYIFNKEEADRMGISYHGLMVKRLFDMPIQTEPEYDISFIGTVKNRYSEIIKIYEKLTQAGIKCHFYLSGVDRDKQVYKESIIYCNDIVDDWTHFQYIVTAKCILELQTESTVALTDRPLFAVLYGRKVLTNNKKIMEFEYYDKNMMQYYENVDDIDMSFFYKENVPYNYKGEFEPKFFFYELKKIYKEKYGEEIQWQ